MHGVKRLFAWMIPRFDRTRFNVSLISLRKRDLSDDTLDELGHRRHLPASIEVRSRDAAGAAQGARPPRQADVVHLHGYGASTFGRLAAAIRRLPVVVHEHANLTDTPWFQKVADRLLAPCTDIAMAVSQSTAEFMTRARLHPGGAHQGRLSRRAARGVQPAAHAGEVADARRALGMPRDAFAIGTVTRLMPSKGNEYLVEAARQVVDALPHARVYIVGEGRAAGASSRRGRRRLELGDRLVFTGFRRDVAEALSAFDLVVVPVARGRARRLTVLEALAMGKPIVSTDADGLQDVLTDGTRRGDGAPARRGGAWPMRSSAGRRSGGAGAACRQRADDRRSVRHRPVRPEDGTALRAAARDVAGDEARRDPRRGPELSDERSDPRSERALPGEPSVRDAIRRASVGDVATAAILFVFGGFAVSRRLSARGDTASRATRPPTTA